MADIEAKEHDVGVQPEPEPNDAGILSAEERSPGVRRMEVFQGLGKRKQALLFASIFCIACVPALYDLLWNNQLPIITSAYAGHPAIAVISTISSVIGAAAQPTAAKLADVFGRIELMIVASIFYLIGIILNAFATNIETFCAASIIYRIGSTTITLLLVVIIADITPLTSRLLFSYIPASPLLILIWAEESISQRTSGKSWGRDSAICGAIYLFFILLCLVLVGKSYWRRNPEQSIRWLRLHSMLDIGGIFLLVVIFTFILVPLAERFSSKWLYSLLILGLVFIGFWIPWEQDRGENAMVTFELIKDRAVYWNLGIGFMLNFTWSLQRGPLPSVLRVICNETSEGAGRILAIYTFASILSGIFLGVFVRFSKFRRIKFRRIKPFIFGGTVLYFIASGVHVAFPGKTSTTNHAGIIITQVLLGIAAGFFAFPSMVSIQAATKHEHVAVMTGLYLTTFNIGNAFGGTISEMVLTQRLVQRLMETLPEPYHNNRTMAKLIRDSPVTFINQYAIDTAVRDSMVSSYRDVHFVLAIIAFALCTILIAFALLIRNTELVNRQSHPQAETAGMYGYEQPVYEDCNRRERLWMWLWETEKT